VDLEVVDWLKSNGLSDADQSDLEAEESDLEKSNGVEQETCGREIGALNSAAQAKVGLEWTTRARPQTLVTGTSARRRDDRMRNVIYAINLTLDGCCDHTKFNPDEETFSHYISLIRDVDLFVYGRKTYQLMVPYWPDVANNPSESKADIDFARTFVSKKKIVFSRSLASADDGNTRIVRTNLRDEILKLKQEAGKPILVGGVDIPSQLIKLGLVGEFRIVIAPIVVGEGRRLMEGVSLPQRLRLKLVESKTFKSGSVALRYTKQ
jgi:dihydrofolate reductase